MSETRRRFDAEFKEGAVLLVIETPRPVAQVARELGVHAGILGNWVAAARRRGAAGGLDPDERAELVRLRRINVEFRRENDLPKQPVVALLASCRTDFGVPHAITCRTVEVSESWF